MAHHVFALGFRVLGRTSLPPCAQRTIHQPPRSTQVLPAPRLVPKTLTAYPRPVIDPKSVNWAMLERN